MEAPPALSPNANPSTASKLPDPPPDCPETASTNSLDSLGALAVAAVAQQQHDSIKTRGNTSPVNVTITTVPATLIPPLTPLVANPSKPSLQQWKCDSCGALQTIKKNCCGSCIRWRGGKRAWYVKRNRTAAQSKKRKIKKKKMGNNCIQMLKLYCKQTQLQWGMGEINGLQMCVGHWSMWIPYQFLLDATIMNVHHQ